MTAKHDFSKFIKLQFPAKNQNLKPHRVLFHAPLSFFFLLYVVFKPIVQNITLVEFLLFFSSRKTLPEHFASPSSSFRCRYINTQNTHIWIFFFSFCSFCERCDNTVVATTNCFI
uniref:(northern house mosquito) hypothetical protein n=1 Tax=Culex pipiens TaxID=7175 RepID=A0A8D8CTU4_CULPI